MNILDIIVILLLLLAVVFAVRSILSKKKKGGACSCGCSGCSFANECHKKPQI